MKKKIILLIVLSIVLCCKKKYYNAFSAGSYAFSERYYIDKTEKETIDMIKKLKEKNPEFIMPLIMWAGEPFEYKDGKNKHWYYVHVYIKEENRAIKFYIRGDYYPTTIGLFSVTTKNNLTNWKSINTDFDDEENKHIIRWFEENILEELEKEGVKIERETFFGTEPL